MNFDEEMKDDTSGGGFLDEVSGNQGTETEDVAPEDEFNEDDNFADDSSLKLKKILVLKKKLNQSLSQLRRFIL